MGKSNLPPETNITIGSILTCDTSENSFSIRAFCFTVSLWTALQRIMLNSFSSQKIYRETIIVSILLLAKTKFSTLTIRSRVKKPHRAVHIWKLRKSADIREPSRVLIQETIINSQVKEKLNTHMKTETYIKDYINPKMLMVAYLTSVYLDHKKSSKLSYVSNFISQWNANISWKLIRSYLLTTYIIYQNVLIFRNSF